MTPPRCLAFATALLLCVPTASGAAADPQPPAIDNLQAADVSYQAEKEIQNLATAFIDTSPINLGDGIAVGELGTDGGLAKPLVAFAEEIARGEHGEVDSLLICQDGKLLFESYFRRGRVNYPHYQMSITKSYTALAIGRAIQLGHLTMTDLNRPIISFFDNIDAASLADGASGITLAEVMSMQSGIRLPSEKANFFRTNAKALHGSLQVIALLQATNAIGTAPRPFKYQGTDPALAMQVLNAVVPDSAEHFIKTELLDRLGITSYAWPDDVSGLPKSAAGSSMRSRDMLKWGLLVANNGTYKGSQFIPADFIEKATSPRCQTANETSYGFFFWRHTATVNDNPVDCISCRGAGGQFIFLLPDHQLIAVVTAHNKGMGPFLKNLPERLLQAF
jgi:CubicO group peptidase (beta-lactamase class C family)